MQIARALMTAADEALDQIGDQSEQDQLRTRMRNNQKKAQRQQLRTLPKRHALIGNTIAPGVPCDAYFHKVLGDTSLFGMR